MTKRTREKAVVEARVAKDKVLAEPPIVGEELAEEKEKA